MVKCRDCGYLCVRKNYEVLAEVPVDVRETWGENHVLWRTHETKPICFVLAFPERDRKLAEDNRKFALQIVGAERECPQFVKWHQGLSPKEHHDMEQQMRLLEWQRAEAEKQRAWLDEQKRRDQDREERLEAQRDRRAQEQREADRKWQEEQKEKELRWQEKQGEQQLASQRRATFVNNLFVVTAAIIGAMAGAVLAYYLSGPAATPTTGITSPDGKQEERLQRK